MIAVNTHHLKILEDFAYAIVMGHKFFEVRKNDRGYQKGDIVKFTCVDNDGNTVFSPINERVYRITYVLSGYGIENGYVVFGIMQIKENEEWY